MKWNGIVSHCSHRSTAPRFAAAKASQASSTPLRLSKAVPGVAYGFDRRARAELLPQSPDTDVDHVRMRIEVIAPDLREQALTADDLACTLEEAVKKLELAVREVDDSIVQLRLPARQVERQRPCPQDVAVPRLSRPPQMHANAGKQLVERERLGQVVARAELEAVELGCEIRAGRDDHHGHGGLFLVQDSQHAQAVQAR